MVARMTKLRTILLALAVVLAVAVPALAATSNGITPQTPKKGAKVPEGTRPIFRGSVSGPGTVWVHVSTSKKVDKDGVIANKQMISQAKIKKGIFTLKAPFFDYPEFWLNTPGTYYWQAHRIACGEDGNDCLQEGPVVKFKVV
jgi:hypothetical protein